MKEDDGWFETDLGDYRRGKQESVVELLIVAGRDRNVCFLDGRDYRCVLRHHETCK